MLGPYCDAMITLKRLLVFVALGPLLGYIMAFWFILSAFNFILGGWDQFDVRRVVDYHQVVLLPAAYSVGLVPALLAGLFDGFLASRQVRHRVLWCTLFGFAVSFVPLVTPLAMGFVHGPYLLIFGFIGAVPAATCSWVAGKWIATARPTER
jgi:hypothetical protein